MHPEAPRLARSLAHLRDELPFVVAIADGGVLLGDSVATLLGAPCGVVVVTRALTRDGVAVAAMCEDRIVVDDAAVATLGVNALEVERLVERARAGETRRVRRVPMIAGRSVILIDDAVISGLTARAAIAALHARGVQRIVVAALMGSTDQSAALAAGADEVIVVTTLPAGVAARVHGSQSVRPPAVARAAISQEPTR